MGDTETAVPADVTLSEEQLDDFARLLMKCLGRDNTTRLAQEAGGPEVVQQAGNDVGDLYAYIRGIAGALQTAGRISHAIEILFEGTHRNGPLAFGVRRILSGGRLDSDEAVEAFVNEFQPLLSSASMMDLLPRIGRTVCAVALDAPPPFDGLRGSGFLIGPDVVITNFHVLEPFLEVDPQTKIIRPVGPGDKIFFFFDYMLKPEPNVPPNGKHASVCVTAAKDWMVQARVRLDKDGEVPSPTKVTDEYDYVVVRLARPIGRQSHRRSGGGMRGWLPPETKIDTLNTQRRILVFQHPQRAPQQFDIGEYVQLDPSGSRVWYTVSTAKGSSGGAAVDTEGRLFALHNAEVRVKVEAAKGRPVNQGVRIDLISKDFAAVVPREEVPEEGRSFYWSLNDDLRNSQPIIGRDTFRDMVTQMAATDPERVLVVSGPPESGLQFSIKLLRHMLGGAGVPVAIFTPEDLQSETMTPKQFLRRIVGNLGIIGTAGRPIPELTSTDSLPHWLRVDLPQWLLELLTRDQALNSTAYPKWVVINTVVAKEQSFLWAENLPDLIAALLGVHDADNPGVDLPQLRWLFLVKDPDANTNPVPLPLGGVKHLKDDLSKETSYVTDFVDCLQRAWRANNKKPLEDVSGWQSVARLALKHNQQAAPDKVVPPRKALAVHVSEMITDNLLNDGGGE